MQDRNKIKLNSGRQIFALIILVALGILGNFLSVPLYSGVDFLFGGMAILVITNVFGVYFGLAASVLASIHTYFLWNHPYGILIFGLETIWIGILKRNNRNIIIRDVIYWIFIGMPLIWFIYTNLLGVPSLEAVLIMLKEFVNGVFNALLASIFLSHVPFIKWILRSGRRQPQPVSQILFNVISGCVLLPAIILSIIISNNELAKIKTGIRDNLNLEADRMSGIVNNWQMEHIKVLENLADYASDNGIESAQELQIQVKFIVNADKDFRMIFAADKNGKAVVSSQETDFIGKPTPDNNYSDSLYFKKLLEKNEPSVIFVPQGEIMNKPTILMSVPIFNKRNMEFIGFVSGAVDINSLPGILQLTSSETNQYITILDSENSILATTNPELRTVQRLIQGEYDFNDNSKNSIKLISPYNPKLTSMEKWRNSYYLKYANIGYGSTWRLIIQVPFKPYQQQMELFYIRNLIITIILIIIALLVGTLLSKLMTNPIIRLSLVTSHLPSKLLIGEDIEWPMSKIFEIDTLINNFKQTAAILRHKFREVKETRDKLEQMAYYDPMTGLPNRIMFKRQLENKIREAYQDEKSLAIMFLDLDRFKIVNDTLGHALGDELLKLVSQRISQCCSESSLLARIGGDEFILLMDNFGSQDEVSKTAERIIESLERPFILSNQEFFVTVSIGISVYPGDGENFEELIKNADYAMYRAKELGRRDFKFFDKTMNDAVKEKLLLESSLRKAIEREEFIIHYQPQLDLERDEVIGMEALVRWNNPTLGIVSPAKFVPLLEETGLIVIVGEWVLRTACRQNKLWQEEGLNPIKVSVNLSAKQFQQKSLIDKIEKILAETGLEPKWLELEITESIAIEDVHFTMETLEKLKSMGINISLDDFGTGFSSLSYLKNFKIDTLKIDASFVRDIYNGENDASIVSTIISLAKNLKLRVIAEGVETETQLGFLKESGCDEIQGYLYSKPLPKEELGEFLRKYIS